MRTVYYVECPGEHLGVRGSLDSAKRVAERKAEEYGYARVCSPVTKGHKLLHEVGKMPEGWVATKAGLVRAR